MIYLCDNSRHLICEPYGINNLHVMAQELDINKCWYHSGAYPHYDIPKRRILEITNKCIIISTRELFKIIKKWQKKLNV